MTTLETRSAAELRRLRDRAANETIRELLNAELTKLYGGFARDMNTTPRTSSRRSLRQG